MLLWVNIQTWASTWAPGWAERRPIQDLGLELPPPDPPPASSRSGPTPAVRSPQGRGVPRIPMPGQGRLGAPADLKGDQPFAE